ncbi:MAG: 2-C-methyl-D-erythritol 4-phosphate cytidylyltransferase [Elusimicrobia bacterium RIFOXYD2_FULL_34_15]|nr:MAG: 2-C-methyl-D-erythritol 4-phosphate cytidylyltransferase [Elusimicrobia bacterium RIFOXYD2_FULL_34_15]
MNISAIIVAAGSGKRFGSKKQFEYIGHRRIFEITLSKFLGINQLKNIVIVLPKDNIKNIIKNLKFPENVKIVSGGKTRQHSVFNGLSALPLNTDIVIIHDGVRPFISKEIISESISAAKKCGAAIVAVPVKDTVKIVKNEYIISTPERRNIFLAQTPQTFKYSIIMQAYKKAFKNNYFSTDDSALVEKLGRKVRIVLGEYKNIKITTKDDIKNL